MTSPIQFHTFQADLFSAKSVEKSEKEPITKYLATLKYLLKSRNNALLIAPEQPVKRQFRGRPTPSESVFGAQHEVSRLTVGTAVEVAIQGADVLLVQQVVDRRSRRPLRCQLIAGHQVDGGVVALLDLRRLAEAPGVHRQVDRALPVHPATNGQALQFAGQAVGGPDLDQVGGDAAFDALVLLILDHTVAVAGSKVPVGQQFATDFHIHATGLGFFAA